MRSQPDWTGLFDAISIGIALLLLLNAIIPNGRKVGLYKSFFSGSRVSCACAGWVIICRHVEKGQKFPHLWLSHTPEFCSRSGPGHTSSEIFSFQGDIFLKFSICELTWAPTLTFKCEVSRDTVKKTRQSWVRDRTELASSGRCTKLGASTAILLCDHSHYRES